MHVIYMYYIYWSADYACEMPAHTTDLSILLMLNTQSHVGNVIIILLAHNWYIYNYTCT